MSFAMWQSPHALGDQVTVMSNKTLWNHTSILASSRWLWAYGSYLCQNNFILNQFCLVSSFWNSTEGWASFSLCCATHLPERQPLLSDSFCHCFSGVFLGHLSLWLCLFPFIFPPSLLFSFLLASGPCGSSTQHRPSPSTILKLEKSKDC